MNYLNIISVINPCRHVGNFVRNFDFINRDKNEFKDSNEK